MNDKRKKLLKILEGEHPIRIIVEHRDRLTRFGFNYINTLINSLGGEIIVVNKSKNETEEIINDLLAIVYSFAAKLYSKRRAKNIKEVVRDAVS